MNRGGASAARSRIEKNRRHKIGTLRFGQWSDVATIGVMG